MGSVLVTILYICIVVFFVCHRSVSCDCPLLFALSVIILCLATAHFVFYLSSFCFLRLPIVVVCFVSHCSVSCDCSLLFLSVIVLCHATVLFVFFVCHRSVSCDCPLFFVSVIVLCFATVLFVFFCLSSLCVL